MMMAIWMHWFVVIRVLYTSQPAIHWNDAFSLLTIVILLLYH